MTDAFAAGQRRLPLERTNGCGACASSRREFIELSAATLVTMVGTAWAGLSAQPLPVSDVQGVPASPTERSYTLPGADGVTIDREGQVILVRVQGRVYAFNLACPHENTVLRWREKDARFQCPRHESKYQPDGTFMSGRATRNMDRFAVRRSGDAVVVDVSQLYRSDRQATQWAAAMLVL